MNLSDRDSKIILILLIVALAILPYTLYVKDTRVETENIRSTNDTLRERLQQLQTLDAHRGEYIAETERLNKERDDMIASFPADVRTENYLMFLLGMEVSSAENAAKEMAKIAEDEELQRPGYSQIDGNSTVVVDTVSFAENYLYPISSEESTNQLQAVVNTSNLTYQSYYEGMKYMLDYILHADTPMIYKGFTAEYDPDTGLLVGEMQLEQYAISGLDRTLDEPEVWPDLDQLHMRGNEVTGIFGELSSETLFERIQREGGFEEEEEEVVDEEDGDGEGEEETE